MVNGIVDATRLEREVGALIDLVAGTDITELEVECDGLRVVLRREPGGAHAASVVAVATTAAEPEPPAPVYVSAPLVGIFHRGNGADGRPLVEVGDEVVPGQVVGIIEAMRLPNQVEAEVAGVVERVLVEDGEPVEYGQPLIELRRPGT